MKRAVLICDAPSHGGGYYKKEGDNHPKGTPDMPPLKKIIEQFKKKNIALQVV